MAEATEVGQIKYTLDLDDAKFKKGISQAKDDAGGLGDSLLGAGKTIVTGVAGAAVAATAALTAIGIEGIKNFSEAQDAVSQLNAVLKSTHNAAGLYIEDLTDQASALQKLTKFSDEAIEAGQGILLTFTNIKGPVFQQATETILDMSQALGQDLQSSAIQLGKALNDPIQGVTALQRVGVSFTDKQKEQIETMVKSGKTVQAQNMILKELQTEFGGSAKAAGQTFSGSMAIAQNAISDFMERVGEGLVKQLQPLLEGFIAFVTNENNIKVATDILTVAFDVLGKAIKFIFNTINTGIQIGKALYEYFTTGDIVLTHYNRSLWYVINTLADFWDVITQQIIPALVHIYDIIATVLGPSLSALWQNISTNLIPALLKLWQVIAPLLLPLLEALGVIIGVSLVASMWLIINVINVLVSVITGWITVMTSIYKVVIPPIHAVLDAFLSLVSGVTKNASQIYDAIVKPFDQAFTWIRKNVKGVYDALSYLNPFAKHSPSLVDMVTRGTKEIADLYGGLFDELGGMNRGLSLPGITGLGSSQQGTATQPPNIVTQNNTIYNQVDYDAGIKELGMMLDKRR